MPAGAEHCSNGRHISWFANTRTVLLTSSRCLVRLTVINLRAGSQNSKPAVMWSGAAYANRQRLAGQDARGIQSVRR